MSFSIHNTKHNGRHLSELIKPGCIAAVIADWGDGTAEVARACIVEWNTSNSGSSETFNVLAYDELFNLQKSQDNGYISEGTGTKDALTAIFEEWKIPVGEYKGPDVRHAKTLFKNDYLSDIILKLLDAAKMQGAEKCIVRATEGAVSVIPKGSNETIYHFVEGTNLTLTQDKLSTQTLVTRVKVVATEDEDGRHAVEAIEDGQTQYGIRQRIYNRSEDDSLATAIAAAQEIINEEGTPEHSTSIEAPDVPVIRKGDKIHVTTHTLSGYYYVESVQHDAANCHMSMTIEQVEPPKPEDPAAEEDEPPAAGSDFEKGDAVILNGAVYVDSYGNGKGKTFTNHTCSITIKVDTSRPCPYHVDGIGWVYPSTITKA